MDANSDSKPMTFAEAALPAPVSPLANDQDLAQLEIPPASSPMERIQDSDQNSLHDPFEDFLISFEKNPNAEEKLRVAIDFMRTSLAQGGSPDFRGFWESRKLCLPLFRETSPAIRSLLWGEYIELTREGRKLKHLLDEETAFAVEQIEIAISALVKEVAGFHEQAADVIAKSPELNFPRVPQVLEEKYELYEEMQKKLNLLNAFASRVNALRKELIKREMRIRQKNKFFQQLSELGDHIFPARKDLIKQVSEMFLGDVGLFVEEYFSPETFSLEQVRRQVFFLRDEIKSLQALAKELTLNTHAFTTTREQLSQCWDQLKGLEKELKKELAERKSKSGENAEEIRTQMQGLLQTFNEGGLTLQEGFKALEEIQTVIRSVELTKDDVRALREEFKNTKAPFLEKSQREEGERKQKEQEHDKARREKFTDLKRRIEQLVLDIETGVLAEVTLELESCQTELKSVPATKEEKQILERKLRGLRDQLAEREEKALIALSDADRQIFEKLQEMLKQRKSRRAEIKEQIEEYRKIMGGSSLDFEKAITYNELMTQEKERLEKIDESIVEIDQKIKEFKRSQRT